MDYISYVPPLTPDMIPEGCYPLWDMEKKVWTFPNFEEREEVVSKDAYIPPVDPTPPSA